MRGSYEGEGERAGDAVCSGPSYPKGANPTMTSLDGEFERLHSPKQELQSLTSTAALRFTINAHNRLALYHCRRAPRAFVYELINVRP
jgi:hypothetical protein